MTHFRKRLKGMRARGRVPCKIVSVPCKQRAITKFVALPIAKSRRWAGQVPVCMSTGMEFVHRVRLLEPQIDMRGHRMRSALYYPHTEIRSETLMKTSLMLWDRVHVIVPFDDYKPQYSSSELQTCFDMIGRCHCPSSEEKKRTHELVEDFATRPLPDSFSYVSTTSPNEVYEVYPQKLLPETWDILQQANLAGTPLPNADYPTANATGLSLMSLLADCCAGDSLARITDRSAAYASLAGLLTQSPEDNVLSESSLEGLLALNLKVIDADGIPISQWVKLREREVGAADGYQVRDLRHRFVDNLEKQASRLAKAKSTTERDEIRAQIEEENLDDCRDLREALKLEAWQMLPTKEVLVSVLGGAAQIVGLALNTTLPMPDVVSATGAVAAIGGLLASRSKYVMARRRVLQEHPLSYLYEARGGLRW
jgi:hypothetical protein